jgi:putative glycosyltransferase (TIGR04372 family)
MVEPGGGAVSRHSIIGSMADSRSRIGELKARLVSRLMRARAEGVARTAAGLAGRAAALILGLALLPLALAGHALGYRRITFITQRVGHLAMEPACFLKAQALGELPERKWFFLAPAGQVSNEHLLSYWARSIRVVRNPLGCFLLRALSALGLMRYDAGRYVLWLNHSQEVYRLNAAWGGRRPVLGLSEEDRAWSDRALREIGLPEGAWHVCFHVREPGFSPGDEYTHSHRNGSIGALLPAIEEIARRGGWCVRMGDAGAAKLAPMPGVIDYARHARREPRLDVCLCARARFFLGNSSGIALVSTVFGVPAALANMVPLSCLGMHAADLSIPKLFRRGGRLLRFDEVFGTPAANFRYAYQYASEGLELVESAPEEILELVGEMLDRLEGRHAGTDDEERRQARFKSLFRPGDYGYGGAARVGAAFLRRHENLLG